MTTLLNRLNSLLPQSLQSFSGALRGSHLGTASTTGATSGSSPSAALALNHELNYPTPVNLSYFRNFGSLSALCLGLRPLSGIFLTQLRCYSGTLFRVFDRLKGLMHNLTGGRCTGTPQPNGIGDFFGVLYLHGLRGLLYRGRRHSNGTAQLPRSGPVAAAAAAVGTPDPETGSGSLTQLLQWLQRGLRQLLVFKPSAPQIGVENRLATDTPELSSGSRGVGEGGFWTFVKQSPQWEEFSRRSLV